MTPGACNRYGYLDRALDAANAFDHRIAGPASWSNMIANLDAERPIGTRIAWSGQGAHFAMLTGYDDVARTVTVDDPHYGRSIVAFAAYPSRYHSGGTWTDTYFTRRA